VSEAREEQARGCTHILVNVDDDVDSLMHFLHGGRQLVEVNALECLEDRSAQATN
jgi:hypothetical protein